MLNNGRILVVDDTPANLEVVSEMLIEAGYAVATAIDGDRALRRLQVYLPDLILLDIQMPGIDGFETCLRLKSDPVTAGIPVIFITALSDTDSKVKGFDLGAVDYVTKPFQQQEVLARIKTHLQLQRLSQHLEQSVADRTIELKTALADLHQSHLQLVQSEKMSALGHLIAGVAHEINNPIGCIVGNVSVAQNAICDLFHVIDLYRQKFPQADAEIEAAVEAIELDYLREDLPKLIEAMKNGGDRITAISRSLRIFSRADHDQKQPFHLHEGIDSTLLILHYRLKANEHRPAIEVVTDYGNIPALDCFPSQLNQVFMNILANAIDAIDEANQWSKEIRDHPNRITIRTAMEGEQIKVSIADNGMGIEEEVKSRVFDHLFTTKGIDRGTGLGLAIAQQIVVEKHGGTIAVNSKIKHGTEFVFVLPIV